MIAKAIAYISAHPHTVWSIVASIALLIPSPIAKIFAKAAQTEADATKDK